MQLSDTDIVCLINSKNEVMNKKRNEELMQKAENALQDSRVKILKANKIDIKDSYSGQTAALGVTIAMSGLRPALAIYQQETDGCNRLEILNAIAIMLGNITPSNNRKLGEELFHRVLSCDDAELKKYRKNTIDCSIALKQVIRSYNLVKS